MGSKFLSGIPWPKKLTVFDLNEKDLNIFVFVAQRALPCPKSCGKSIPRERLIHFIVVCVTKASKTRNLNFETPYLSSLILLFPFSIDDQCPRTDVFCPYANIGCIEKVCSSLDIILNNIIACANRVSRAFFSVFSQCNVIFCRSKKIKNEWKWQYADKYCACSSKKEKAERAKRFR